MAEEDKRNFIERVKDLLNQRTTKQMSMSEIMQNMPLMSEDDVDVFLTTCHRQRLYDCVILAAVRYDRIEQMFHFKGDDLLHILRHLFQGDLLVDMAAENWWPCWNGLLSRCTESETLEMLLWLSRNPVNSEALRVFQMLLGRFSSHPLLGLVVRDVLICGLICQYKLLLYTDNIIHKDASIREHLHQLIFLNHIYRSVTRQSPDASVDHDGCLVVACEAGLFSAPASSCRTVKRMPWELDTPIFLAVQLNKPELVQLIYSTGTVSNCEVFQLIRDPELRKRCEKDMNREDAKGDGHAARKIRSFLVDKASQPRSLKSLCLAEVSKRVGWGYVRKTAVKQLEVPRILKEDLMTNCDETLLKYKSK